MALKPKMTIDITREMYRLASRLEDGNVRNFDVFDGNKCLIGQLLKRLYNTKFYNTNSTSVDAANMEVLKLRARKLLRLSEKQFYFLWYPYNRKTVRGIANKLRLVAKQIITAR